MPEIGQTISHYRIIERLGQGGMGEVFLANDLSLGRKVALKFLSRELQQDPEARKRLLREAKAAAALDHPNICNVHEVAEADGEGFIVMEFVEGQSLKDRLLSGPLPMNEALQVASEVAGALEEAHEKGIIHRDLKPANIMLTNKGRAKVMDYGLAKQLIPAGGIESQEETVSAMTRSGTTVGTLAYMSPEQLRGGPVDARSDIFSFGVVLYEMLTGVHPFKRNTGMDTASAILKENPVPLVERLPDAPQILQHTLRRMLAKDANRRYQHVRDVQADLQDLLSEAGHTAAAGAVMPVSDEARGRRKTGRLRSMAVPLSVSVGLAATIAGVAVWKLKPTPRSGEIPTFRVTIPVSPGRHLSGGVLRWEPFYGLDRPSRTAMGLSPDGKHLVYSAVTGSGLQLFLKAMGDVAARPLAGTEGGSSVFFSPDGKWVGFYAAEKLRKAGIPEGPVVTICDTAQILKSPPFGASWGPEDTILFAGEDTGLYRVSAAGGTPEEHTRLDVSRNEMSHRLPHFLPGGKAFLFTIMFHIHMWDKSQTVVQILETGERKTLIREGADGRYVPTGHLVYAREGVLNAVPFDLEQMNVSGPDVPIMPGIMQAVDPALPTANSGAAQFSYSQNGLMVFAPGGLRPHRKHHIVIVDRNGSAKSLPYLETGSLAPRLSPDGRFLAYADFSPHRSLWLYDIAHDTPPRRLTLKGWAFWSSWTPDGRQLAFDWTEAGPQAIYLQPVDGSGRMQKITAREGRLVPGEWTQDGKHLAIIDYKANNLDILTLRAEGGNPECFLCSQYNEAYPSFSPDGRWLAYASDESGQYEVYIRPFQGKGEFRRISTAGGIEAHWSPDGRELFYRQLQGRKFMVVDMTGETRSNPGTPRVLFDDSPFFTATPFCNYDVTRDGKHFFMVKREPEQSQAVTEMILVTNWFEELKRLVPTGK